MIEHTRYVKEQFDAGHVLIYGPVLATSGAFGIAILEMMDESSVRQFAENDPSIRAGVNTFEFHRMKVAAAQGSRVAHDNG